MAGWVRRRGRVEFNRPPRLREALPSEEVYIPSPPQAPAQGRSAVTALLVPMISTLATSSIFIAFAFANPGANQTLMFILGGAMLIGATLPTTAAYVEGRRRGGRDTKRLEEDYSRRLRARRRELETLREAERDIRRTQDPDQTTLLARAQQLHRRLWERRLTDDDFLALRLGEGLGKSVLKIRWRGDDEPGSTPGVLRDEANALVKEFHLIGDVPLVVNLKRLSSVGLVGTYERTAALGRAMLLQAATHHGPDDLAIVGFLSESRLGDWAWLKWLPHVRPERATDAAETLLSWSPHGAEQRGRWVLHELANRRRLLDETSRRTSDEPPTFPWLLLFADDLGAARSEPAFQLALAEGSRLNVSIIGLADSLASLPQRMGGVAAFKDPAEKLLSYTDVGAEFEPVECDADAATPTEAEDIARALGAITPAPEHGSDKVSLPDRLSLFEALDIPTIDHLDVHAAWTVPDLAHLLRLPLGLTSGESLLELDLKEQGLGGHGPHGLVAGTTGAGKSELLLTIIAGLALAHPPDVLNFVLIDYKGGDAFSSVVDLPHTLALITDLDEHLANRSLVFLTSELKQRERRLGELKLAEVTSAAEYQIARPAGQAPMPLLVIVVDEFARLKAELPDFVRGLVDVARVGRSLGVHLILATQTPGGSVDEEIKKNTNFGICLRVRDTSDSNDVIGEPDAFLLPGSLPGRAYFRAGLEPMHLFQTARVGAPYRPRQLDEPITVQTFGPRSGARLAHAGDGLALETAARVREISVLVERLRMAGRGKEARRWPGALPDEITLVGTPDREPTSAICTLDNEAWQWPATPAPDWLKAPIGLVDRPRQQLQEPFDLDLARNSLIYGGSNSGKSTLLRTLAVSMAITHSPSDLHIYVLDFGSRALRGLRSLPHCGPEGVFFATETDRVWRLFRYLRHQLAQRREAGITNLRQQRRESGVGPDGTRWPAFLLVLLDNFAAFRETFEDEEQTRRDRYMLLELTGLMRDGPAVGINFVLTATQVGGVLSTVENAAEEKLVLRQQEASNYSILGRMERPPTHMPPGRGFAAGVPPLEFQVALPPPDGLDEGALSLEELGRRMAAGSAGGDIRAVRDLPRWISASDPRLAASGGGLSVLLGLDDETDAALRVDLSDSHHVLIAGPAGSGRTSLLATCLLSSLSCSLGRLARWYVASPRSSALSELQGLGNWRGFARNAGELGGLLSEVEVEVNARRENLRGAGDGLVSEPLFLVLDDFDLLGEDDEFPLVQSTLSGLAKRGRLVGLHILLAGFNVELRRFNNTFIQQLAQLSCGVLLQPDVDADGDMFGGLRLRRLSGDVPPGRGYLVRRRQQRLFQAATYQPEGAALCDGVRERAAEEAGRGLRLS